MTRDISWWKASALWRATLRTSAIAGATLLLTASGPLGCFGNKSQLVAGKRVSTGKRNYDSYFEKVMDVSEKVDALDSDMFPLREPLTTALDLDEDVGMPDLLYATKKRASTLKGYGVRANLQLTATPTVIVERGEMREDEQDEALFKAVQEASVRAMATYKEYSALLDEIVELDEKRGPLAERIDRLGPNHPQRSRIEAELVGAGRVLETAERKLLRDTRTVAHYLVGLSEAIDTGALESRESKCEEAINNAGKPRWKRPRPRPRPRPGGGGGGVRPRPKPKPAPAPAGGGGDFDM